MSQSVSPKTVLVIGKVWPEPTSSAAGSRILQILAAFQSQGFRITFGSSAGKSPFSFDLNSIGIEEVEIQLNNSGFDAFVSKLDPDLVLFDRFSSEEQFGWRVAEQCPNALRILDTEDLHCLREGRRLALNAGKEFNPTYLNNDIAKREIASILRCDLSLIISKVEMEFLRTHFRIPDDLLLYLPFIVDENFDKPCISYEERKHFISIGNFLHEPNWDAVRYLKSTIWPLIKAQLPKAELYIYGAYASQKVEQLHNPEERFFVKGRAEDARETISSHRVMLAPLRFGAGLKGKFIDAMCTGTPSVSSSIGAEGMHGTLDWPGAVADEPTEFAKAAVELYQNKDDWHRAQSCGEIILKKQFGKEYVEVLVNRVLETFSKLEEHRSGNFLGQMLMHHSLASTKFMSKWIEAKNQNKSIKP